MTTTDKMRGLFDERRKQGNGRRKVAGNGQEQRERDGGHDSIISDQSHLYNMARRGRPQSVVRGARVRMWMQLYMH